MSYFGIEEQFNCSVGCESANKCEYYNIQPIQVDPQVQNYDGGNFYYNNNYDDSVVPGNFYETNIQTQITQYEIPPYQDPNSNFQQWTNTFINQTVDTSTGYSGENYFIENVQTYPPCQGPQPWNFAHCYGYFGDAPCQFANVIDMEDFM